MAGPLQLKATMDPQQWIRNNKEYARIISKAQTLAIRDVGKIARDAGRAQIAESGFGPRWVKSLVVRYKPQKGYSFNPEANVRSTIGYSNVFETGKLITGSPFLWLPLPGVPKIAGRPHMTPKQFEALIGPLVMIHPPGHLPMLVAKIKSKSLFSTFSRIRAFSRASLRRMASSEKGSSQSIPMFVAVPVVKIRKRWSIHEACVEAAKQLQARYNANLENYK